MDLEVHAIVDTYTHLNQLHAFHYHKTNICASKGCGGSYIKRSKNANTLFTVNNKVAPAAIFVRLPGYYMYTQ